MTRSNAREIAVHFVYELHYTDAPATEVIDTRMEQEYYTGLKDVSDIYEDRPNQKQMEYIRSLVSGVQDKRELLESYIEKFAVNWKVNRISRIARAILEVAMYEILYVDDVPAGVAINEAVELCKRYEEEETASFLNGILGSFAKEVVTDVSGS